METTMTTNGKLRKSLGEQIDRLDRILDGLADGLNEAVASAVKDAVTVAVKEAVQTMITAVLTNPDLMGLLRGPMGQAPITDVGHSNAAVNAPVKGVMSRATAWLGRQWTRAYQSTAAMFKLCIRTATAGWQLMRRFKSQALLAVGVGAAAGFATYFAGPWIAAAAAWLGGFASTIAVQVALGLRRALAAVSFSGN
jgi:hypothetical protein